MTLPPIDLSPFRTLVDFLAGAYFALVSHMGEARATTGGSGINGRVSFVEPAISGEFGLFFGVPWELPDGAAPTDAYGYQVFAGNSLVSPFGSLMLVNIGKVIAAYPNESRTHIAFDYIFKARESNPGFLRCEVYRGPPLADVVADVNSGAIYPDIGDSYDTMRTAFQYRREGLLGLFLAAFTTVLRALLGSDETRRQLASPSQRRSSSSASSRPACPSSSRFVRMSAR